MNKLPAPKDVCNLFIEFSDELKSSGIHRYSADAILHRIRWHMHVDKGDREFKCNNNWTSSLARWAMEEHPRLQGMFELRNSPKKVYVNENE